MTAIANKKLVLVEFEYEYKARDGGLVSIKPNERYILLSKTNDHWWHVCKDECTKPFYIPAKYVKELQPDFSSPMDCIQPNSLVNPEPPTDKRPVDLVEKMPDQVIARYRTSVNDNKAEKRMSTFGIPQDIHNLKKVGLTDSGIVLKPHSVDSMNPSSFSKDISHYLKRHSLVPSNLLGSRLPLDDMHPFSPETRVSSFSLIGSIVTSTQVKPIEPSVIKDEELHEFVQLTEQPVDPEGESADSENIYKSIPEIQDKTNSKMSEIDLLALSVLTPSHVPTPSVTPFQSPVPIPGSTPFQSPVLALNPVPAPVLPPHAQVESQNLDMAVYANVAEVRKGFSQSTPSASSSPESSHDLSLESEGWEVHTDKESGQEYYYHPTSGQTTWDNPFTPFMDPESPTEVTSTPSPTLSPHPSLPMLTVGESDWEKLLDEDSGQHYFYNRVSGETSWEPPEKLPSPSTHMEPPGTQELTDGMQLPLPEEDSPGDNQESGTYKDNHFSDMKQAVVPQTSFSRNAPAGWSHSIDAEGKCVFTSDLTHEQWIKSLDDWGQTYYYLKDGSQSQWNLPETPMTSVQLRVETGVEKSIGSVVKTWRNTIYPTHFSASQEVKFNLTHRSKTSDNGSDASSPPEFQHNAQVLEKAGILNKTKVSENGKRVRKNWTQSWTVLHGGILTFHKDPKSTPAGASNKTNHIVPEITVDLRGTVIGWASKDKSSKKNVLELKTRTGAEFLVQYDTESIINDWYKVITDTIRQLDLDHHSEEEDMEADRDEKDKRRISTKQSMLNCSTDSEQKKVRTKLRKFLQKRPTLQSVKEKGYFRDNVFGCPLDSLCAQEKTTIPSFVEKCIKAVEKRGLDIDGIYRVSGNLAVIQKLRYKADHEELDLEDGQWEDVHVITGALKLFFRELPEPLFPYSHFNSFISAIKMSDYNQKVSYMCELVKSLPLPNHDTMELLFRHLRKVIEYGEENRMSIQNVAIVFGPTLLKPETESANITMHMVFQNQIVEIILNEYEQIFYAD